MEKRVINGCHCFRIENFFISQGTDKTLLIKMLIDHFSNEFYNG